MCFKVFGNHSLPFLLKPRPNHVLSEFKQSYLSRLVCWGFGFPPTPHPPSNLENSGNTASYTELLGKSFVFIAEVQIFVTL